MLDSASTTVDHRTMANAIRALSMDAVQAANSGHPGMPMGMADVATQLFSKFIRFDPKDPAWPDRDRFILSAGHGSMLLYSLLYLTGYAHPTLDEIRAFRQLGSPCAGHPEFGSMPGVETTTGPLGQGLAMGVGMALGERLLAARFGDDLVDHHTYVLTGDGCLMEGISHEAISFAGHMKLSKLIVLFDDNRITIDGGTDLSVSDDQLARFTAHGWFAAAADGHDPDAISAAIEAAKADPRPSMIAFRTTIGYGAPNKEGTAATHGAPLGEDEVAAARKTLGWPHPAFEIPPACREAWLNAGRRSVAAAEAWRQRLAAAPETTRTAFEAAQSGELPAGFEAAIRQHKASLAAEPKKMATRKSSQLALEVINPIVNTTVGGSADLTGSNNTKTANLGVVTADDFSGRYIYYGVREFAMGAIMNGLALHGGIVPYGGTFLIFSDYARPAIRLSALMGQRVIYVMTHDSVGLGEDGPTHQPVEHLASLRAMPGLVVYRPADAIETAECWQLALENGNGPSVIALSRQGLAPLRLEHTDDNLSARGGYILKDCEGEPEVTLVATGSEVSLAVEVQEGLGERGIAARVVSMPSTERFAAADEAYRSSVIGQDSLKVSIEAAASLGWDRIVGNDGLIVGLDRFGESAPGGQVMEHLGFSAAAVRERILARLEAAKA
jgi:transketolase